MSQSRPISNYWLRPTGEQSPPHALSLTVSLPCLWYQCDSLVGLPWLFNSETSQQQIPASGDPSCAPVGAPDGEVFHEPYGGTVVQTLDDFLDGYV